MVKWIHFLAFIEVLCDVKQTKNNSDVVRSVAQAVEKVLEIERG